MIDYRTHILICGGTGCKAAESDEIKRSLSRWIEELGLEDEAVSYTHLDVYKRQLRGNPD